MQLPSDAHVHPTAGELPMFNKTLDVLSQLDIPQALAVTLPTDEHGFLDRRCPAPHCLATFKVHLDDWKTKVRAEQAFCPLCRHETDDNQWETPEQFEHMKSLAVAQITHQLNAAIAEDASAFELRTPLINFSMSFDPGVPPMLVPVVATGLMELRVACEVCACRYASIGAAFFCPACGHNSARTTFVQMVETVVKTLNMLPSIIGSARTNGGPDVATNLERALLEANLGRLVSSFQRIAESTFMALPTAGDFNVRQNLFQNLDESSDLWFRATGRSYENILLTEEMTDLRRLFQQRHLLVHREGIVDQRYIDRSGDKTYAVGQRVVVRADAVARLAALVLRVGEELTAVALPTP